MIGVVRVNDDYARDRVPGRYVATLYESGRNGFGETIWLDTRIHTQLRRSRQEAEEDGRLLAERYGVHFMPGCGSLHNRPVLVDAPHEAWRCY